MKSDRNSLLFYAVTDRSWLSESALATQVEEAILGGATFVQLREKELDKEFFLKEAVEIKALCGRYNVPFIVNDDVEIAIACDADGIHIGQHDSSLKSVRSRLGNEKIIGVSAQTVEQAILAEKDGADYLGVGAVFHTDSKSDAADVSIETLRQICAAVSIPVVAIGGINKDNIEQLAGSGICGIAVISAIFAEKDIRKATQQLKDRVSEMLFQQIT